MHIEQRLETCGLCRCVLALQYEWHAGRMPTWSRDRILGRVMRCPACGFRNPFIMLMEIRALQIKVVPGPLAWVPFPSTTPRLSSRAAGRPAGRRSASLTALLLHAAQSYRRLEMFLAWCMGGRGGPCSGS